MKITDCMNVIIIIIIIIITNKNRFVVKCFVPVLILKTIVFSAKLTFCCFSLYIYIFWLTRLTLIWFDLYFSVLMDTNSTNINNFGVHLG